MHSQSIQTPMRTVLPRASGHEQRAEFSSDELAHWRSHVSEHQHPMIVFGAQSQPVVLNDALRARLSEPSSAAGTSQPVAFVWQAICETTGRMVALAAQKTSVCFSEAFPIHGRVFAAVGSLVRNSSGEFLGAVVSLGDLSDSEGRLQELYGGPGGASATESDDRDESYTGWLARRDQARQRMSKLSRREAQVVALVSNGFLNKSIAHELDISVKTIEKHRANATRKLGVTSTPEMVRIAVVADQEPPLPQRSSESREASGVGRSFA